MLLAYRPLVFFVALCIAAASGLAQDVHVTQFYASPLTLNPALTGAFDGQLRASLTYRDQWRGLQPSPFVTTTGALDFRFPLMVGGRESGDAASVGVVFMTDKVREYDFSTNQVMVSGGYHKMLNKRNRQILSGGLSFGIGQRNVNYGNLTWQDEFTIRPSGDIGFFGSTTEELPENNISYLDLSAGINYSIQPKDRPAIFFGLSAHHLNQPDLSFYRRTDNSLDKQPLYRKFSTYLASSIALAPGVSLQPRVLAQVQGPSVEALAGTNLRMAIDANSTTAIHIGSWVRGVKTTTGFGGDAVVGLIGFEYKNVLLGTSYDLGISSFTAGARGRGALEISLAFLGNYENDSLQCPQF